MKCRRLRVDIRTVDRMNDSLPDSGVDPNRPHDGSLVVARNLRRARLGFWVNSFATVRVSTQQTFNRQGGIQLETDNAADRIIFWIGSRGQDYVPDEWYAYVQSGSQTAGLLGIIELIDETP